MSINKITWKNPYVQKKLLTDFWKIKGEDKKIIFTHSRKSTIIPLFVGYIFNVHNGKSFVRFLITREMVGLKLGEFSLTRKNFFFKKQKKLHGTKG